MTFPTFDEWQKDQRPWAEGEFDAAKAEKLIYNLTKDKDSQKNRIAALLVDKDELTGQVREFEEKGLSETERLRRENERLKNGGQAGSGGGDAEDLERVRLEIALDKGLTKAQVKRLVGKNREELEADADAYMEEHGIESGASEDGEQDGGEEGQAPPSNRPKVTRGTNQRHEVPDPNDNLDPMELLRKVRGTAPASA